MNLHPKELTFVVVLVLLVTVIIFFSHQDFMEQCRKDGYTKTDCEMMSTERNRRAFNNY